MFWFGVGVGLVIGVAFCIAWVLVEFGLEMAKVSGRVFDWRKGWFVHAAKRELERENAKRSVDNKAP